MPQVKVTTGAVRLSYAHVLQPAEDPSGNLKYSASLIMPKNSRTPGIIKKAMESLLENPDTQKILGKTRNFTHPLLRDGDEDRPDDAVYQNSFFINAKANVDHKPKIFNRDLVEITDPDEIYSGCWVQAVLMLYPYSNVSKGIGASLIALRKVKDDKPLTNTTVSEADFDDSLLSELDEVF